MKKVVKILKKNEQKVLGTTLLIIGLVAIFCGAGTAGIFIIPFGAYLSASKEDWMH